MNIKKNLTWRLDLMNLYKQFRDWTIQLFFTGDYEFLCVMYGLSGASGRYL